MLFDFVAFWPFLLLGGGSSALICWLITRTVRWHGRLSLDSTFGVQKFHTRPTPRVGGVAMLAGLWLVWLTLVVVHRFEHQPTLALLGPMLWAAVPAFAFGILEDLTKRVSVRARLIATFASGLAVIGLTGVYLTRVNIVGVDALFAMMPLAIAFTMFAIGGVANAINIIDGFNGLSSGVVMIALAAMGAIAAGSNDWALVEVCVLLIAVVGGFWVMNFPFGKIFLGDGGAYTLGFWLAWVAILLPMRNPEVSVWAGLLACGYPVLEVGFTIARRLRRAVSPGRPDRLHLHSLIKGRLVKNRVFPSSPVLNNAAVSVLVWPLAMVPALCAVLDPTDSVTLALSLTCCATGYLWIYGKLTRVGKNAVRQSARSRAPVPSLQRGAKVDAKPVVGASKGR